VRALRVPEIAPPAGLARRGRRGSAVKAVKGLKTAHDINVIIRYEETHKNRSNVASAAQTQLAALAKEAVGVTS
jgi:hypothetical protein